MKNSHLFKLNHYYGDLIHSEKSGNLKNIVIPNCDESADWGEMDISNENEYSKAPFLQHKYKDTVLLLVTNRCECYCRYCFRKRIIIDENYHFDLNFAINYIRENQVEHVILSGGDPLSLDFLWIREILEELGQIDQLKSVRIGTKLLNYNPDKLLQNNDFLNYLKDFAKNKKKLALMTHFVLAEEITTKSKMCIDTLLAGGILLINQFPLLNHINNRPEQIVELMTTLMNHGIISYYIFQCRPVKGNKYFSLPIIEAYDIYTEAIKGLTGINKMVRFVLSHKTGKLEMLGKDSNYFYFRYHRAVNQTLYGKLFRYKYKKDDFWVNELEIMN